MVVQIQQILKTTETEIADQSRPPEGNGMQPQNQSEPKTSIIEIVEKVAGNETTIDSNVVEYANSFLATLTDEQNETITYEFTEENAAHWTNLPVNSQNLNGVALSDLSEKSVESALVLAKSALSEQGFNTMLGIIRSDEFLTTDTGRTKWGSVI